MVFMLNQLPSTADVSQQFQTLFYQALSSPGVLKALAAFPFTAYVGMTKTRS